MALENNFREVAIAKSSKQPQMVDQLLEETPLLESMIAQDSTDELHNVFEELVDVVGAQFVNADEALPVVSVDTQLKQQDMSIIGGKQVVGEDKAKRMGGAAQYFAAKQPFIFRKTGNDLEQSIIYNSLRAYAQANGKLVSAGGSTANKQNSILCVTWMPGEITSLLSPTGFGDGAIMDVAALSGGTLYTDSDGREVYGVRYKSYVGMQLANERYVSGICNIDVQDADPDNWDLPSEEDIEIMLENARAGSRSIIYCHPKIWRLVLSKYKASKLQTSVIDADFNRLVNFWDTTPIITSRNFLGDGEAVVSI